MLGHVVAEIVGIGDEVEHAPFGMMSLTSLAKRSEASGVVGAGFTTGVSPTSSAAPPPHARRIYHRSL
ncbi:hypothetical protein J2R87_002111 [Bradyrhizobium elkanii]|nr:hypothetical protein [Bradyrhizobium elkanii]MCS4110129.1 hypothetical protein [Bradyrhizobium elkanii]